VKLCCIANTQVLVATGLHDPFGCKLFSLEECYFWIYGNVMGCGVGAQAASSFLLGLFRGRSATGASVVRSITLVTVATPAS